MYVIIITVLIMSTDCSYIRVSIAQEKYVAVLHTSPVQLAS